MGTRFSRKLLATAAATVTAAVLALPAVAQGVATPSATPAASPSAQAPGGGLIESGEGLRIDWTRGTLSMTGLGFSPDRGSLSQRRAIAHQTALVDGARRLYEALSALRVNGNAFVRDLAAVDEELRASLHALVASTPAKTVTPWPDGSVEVALELPLWGEGGLSGVIARAMELPAPASQAPVDGKPSALVVDGRGTGSQPALAIALKDEAGKLLYHGPVTYFHVPERLEEVAGKAPLTLPARRAVGATRADLTLKPEEAKRFREAREKHPLLPVVVLL